MALWFLLPLLLLASLYVWLIESFRKAWETSPAWEPDPEFSPGTIVSIIVPVRNEGAHLRRCLDSLLRQDYPASLREIIVVDDYSEDDSAAIAASYAGHGVRLVKLEDIHPGASALSSKKRALAAGIERAGGELLATFDGDSWAPPRWLSSMAGYYEQFKPILMAGPVEFSGNESFLHRFQRLDLYAMNGMAAAGIARGWFHLGNGANLFYTKEAFLRIGGFAGVDHLASGDDVFLMQKMAKAYPGRLAWVKSPEALVQTAPASGWKTLWLQRLRWGGKASQYREWQLKAIAVIVLSFCLAIVLSLLICPLAFLIALALKSAADYRLLKSLARFFRRESLLSVFWKAQLCHVLYIALSGTASVFVKRYKWKGRKLR